MTTATLGFVKVAPLALVNVTLTVLLIWKVLNGTIVKLKLFGRNPRIKDQFATRALIVDPIDRSAIAGGEVNR